MERIGKVGGKRKGRRWEGGERVVREKGEDRGMGRKERELEGYEISM